MFIKTWSGSSWITTKEVKVWNGSAWDPVKSGKVWDGTAWVPFYGRLLVDSPISLSAVSFDGLGGFAETSIELFRNGDFVTSEKTERISDDNIVNVTNNWVHNSAKFSTVGDRFEVRANQISGFSLPNTGVWLRLNSTRLWGITAIGGGSASSTITLDFREFGGDGTILYTSGNIELNVAVFGF